MHNHFCKARRLALTALATLAFTAAADGQTMIKYDFTSTTDTSGQYGGELKSTASLTTYEGEPVLDLGTSGYFKFDESVGRWVSGLKEYSVAVNVFIPTATNITGNGNFVWCFAKSSTAGYLFFGAKESRFSITKGTYSGEEKVSAGSAFTKGRWVNVVYSQDDSEGRLYIDGALATSGTVSITPSDIGTFSQCYLGKSCYSGDVLLKSAQYHDFRLYDYAVESAVATEMKGETDALNAQIDAEAMRAAISEFSLGDVSALTRDIRLPNTFQGNVSIAWKSSDEGVITSEGKITRPAIGEAKATATLTATFTTSRLTETKQFEVGVLPQMTTDEALAFAADNIVIGGHPNNLYDQLSLPTTGDEGCVIVWESNDEEWLSNDGRVMKRGEEKKNVVLTATIIKDGKTLQRTFPVCIHEQEPYVGYLFVFFPSNSNENIYYAISNDGYNYTVLNKEEMVLSADSVSIKGGLRDPHLLRGEDGWFYMVATDMKCSEGWSSNRGMVLMRSKDLINWEHHTVHFPDKYAGTTFANVTRVWAPEVIYDKEAGKYLIYYSILTTDETAEYDKVFYNYVNDDFSDIEGEPIYFYDRGSATIDMDIVYNETDSLYHGFFKNEGEGGICKVTAKRLTAAEGEEPGSQWSKPSGTLQQTNVAVEGAGVFKLINEDSWILMYDCYGSGYYQFCSSHDLETFTFVKNTTTSGAFTPRHGTVLPITQSEMEALKAAFPTKSTTAASITGSNNVSARNDLMTTSGLSVTLPVKPGTDLTNFDPQLYGSAGTVITPTGAQNFSEGAVSYTAVNGTSKKTYKVSVVVYANPVLPDFHADPEVLFSKKTGRFYIYPTTDGYANWGGYSFDVFSSPDLVNFTNRGTILYLSEGGDADWAAGNAWAPCIEEKIIDGEYKYFFYYSANNPSVGKKTLGVATADSPEGPFTAQQQPLFTTSVAGQMIDSDVFTDPVSGQTYFYYGNGKLCYRLFADDMVSVVGDEYDITPTGGSLSTYAYREAPYVFYRNGLYYFLWSVDDTGASNYHVAYGTSKSPTGPITVADEPIVIIQDSKNKIYGTGHNSVINIPNTDQWYIVYHRINKNYLNDGPGYHREVCIDTLAFNSDGTIVKTTPTHRGIAPVDMSDYMFPLNPAAITEQQSAPLLRVRYFTADGRSLGQSAPTSRGFFIRQEILADGTSRALKILRQ